jgi:voltage-gated potassium channel
VTIARNMDPTDPQISFPTRAIAPLRSIGRRVGIALGVLLLVAVITWIGRDGYSDADGTPLSFLDAVYYSSVTLTTTGYGDIFPITPGTRAVTAFIVTPLRVVFLIVLVGTTLQLLTERYRKVRAIERWRKRVRNHVVVVGYGTKGRGAIDTVRSGGTPATDVVVIDTSEAALLEARGRGFMTVLGDGTRTSTLQTARVDEARAVIVTCHGDDTATLVTLTARELNPTATIAAGVREGENAHLLSQSGATSVIVSSEAAGHLIGLAADRPSTVDVLQDLLVTGRGLDLTEQVVAAGEVGGPPQLRDGLLPVALVRRGQRIAFDDDAFSRTEAGDTIVYLGSPRPGDSPSTTP